MNLFLFLDLVRVALASSAEKELTESNRNPPLDLFHAKTLKEKVRLIKFRFEV